jgi:hypothetical protein
MESGPTTCTREACASKASGGEGVYNNDARKRETVILAGRAFVTLRADVVPQEQASNTKTNLRSFMLIHSSGRLPSLHPTSSCLSARAQSTMADHLIGVPHRFLSPLPVAEPGFQSWVFHLLRKRYHSKTIYKIVHDDADD